jgi:ankyrin repeat protein
MKYIKLFELFESYVDYSNSDVNQEFLKEIFNSEVDLDKIKTLLELDLIDVDMKDSYSFTPLHWASKKGNSGLVKILLEKGSDINSKNIAGLTALDLASKGSNPEIIKILLEAGADVNSVSKNGMTPICFASITGNLKSVKNLIEFGADVNVKDNNGYSPLYWAKEYNHEEVSQFLEKNGAII